MIFKNMCSITLAAALLLSGCGDSSTELEAGGAGETSSADDETRRLWILPELVECEGVAPQQCMQVAETADGPYKLFYDEILGFSFVEGTEYVIEVSVEEVPDPPADGSSNRYMLVEVVEETPSSEG